MELTSERGGRFLWILGMELTSEGGGRFLWRLGNTRISLEDSLYTWCLPFTFSGVHCNVGLSKDELSYHMTTTLLKASGEPILPLSLEFELLAGGESVSGVCSLTAANSAPGTAEVATSIRDFLRRRTDETFDGPLALRFRMRTEPRDAGAEEPEEAGGDLEEDSENERAGGEVAEGTSEDLEEDSENKSPTSNRDTLSCELCMDRERCKLCMDKERRVLFQPCGHLVSCRQCSNLIFECPVCRSPILSKIRAYLS